MRYVWIWVLPIMNLMQEGGRFRILSGNVSNEQYGIGFKLGNTELRDKVQSTLLGYA